jgi:hypothetical protein
MAGGLIMIGSKCSPSNFKEYSAKDLNTQLYGTKFVATAGTTTNNDFYITDDCLIDGAVFVTINSALGDYIDCQVVDVDNILGYGAGTVLGQYVYNWYVNPNETFQFNYESKYPAKIFGGLYLRFSYVSVGTTNVDIIVNYTLHKVLW